MDRREEIARVIEPAAWSHSAFEGARAQALAKADAILSAGGGLEDQGSSGSAARLGSTRHRTDGAGEPPKSEDPLYADAVALMVNDRRGSTSYLQRKLMIGYNRAAGLMERMQAAGIVSSPDAYGKREVLAPEQSAAVAPVSLTGAMQARSEAEPQNPEAKA